MGSTGGVTHQLVYENPPLPGSPFGEHLHGTQTFTRFAHSESSIYIPFPQISLSLVIQTRAFQVPDNTVKPLATAHESAYNHVWTFLLPSKLDNQRIPQILPTAMLSLHEYSSGMSQEGPIVAAVHFGVVPAYHVKHLQTRPQSFLPLSIGHKELLLRPLEQQEGGLWACGPLLPITSLYLQGLLRPNNVHTTPI